jgi:hypothetical protein
MELSEGGLREKQNSSRERGEKREREREGDKGRVSEESVEKKRKWA